MRPHVEMQGFKFGMVPEWVAYHPDLTPAAVRVYIVLIRHGVDPSSCYPSIARIASCAHVSENTVRKALKELAAVGAVQSFKRYLDDDNRHQTSNGYRVFDSPPSARPSSNIEPHPLQDLNPSPSDSEPTPLQNLNPKESKNNDTHLTRKHTRVDSRENAQQPLIEVDGLTPAASVPDRFQEFWSSYPRKIGKPKAQAAWKRLTKAKVDPQTIIDGCERWATYYAQARTEQRFIPHPTTWLNDARYDDTPEPVSNARASHPTRAPIVERTGETMNMKMVGGKLVPA